jgi:hypothetical protein
LVDAADAVLRLMGRDIHAALPNSVRITSNGNFVALELLESVDAARYRDSGTSTAPDQELDFTGPDAAFATLFDLQRRCGWRQCVRFGERHDTAGHEHRHHPPTRHGREPGHIGTCVSLCLRLSGTTGIPGARTHHVPLR